MGSFFTDAIERNRMNLNSIRGLIRKDIEYFGPVKTFCDLLVRAINRVVFFKILKGIKVEAVNPDYLETDQDFQWQFLSKVQLEELADNPDHDIDASFVQAALDKGDECYGAIDGQVLASYGWYSNKPTETSDELTLHFASEYIYMYKGFTHPKYRGKRLHAIGMNRALREYKNQGYKGLISYVEANNFSSLKSAYRMGYQDFGRIVILKTGTRPFIYASPGCREYDFCFRETDGQRQSEPAMQNQ
jgi:GNAT superfamily N-acetyltransferase